jgi:hypothetical protein
MDPIVRCYKHCCHVPEGRLNATFDRAELFYAVSSQPKQNGSGHKAQYCGDCQAAYCKEDRFNWTAFVRQQIANRHEQRDCAEGQRNDHGARNDRFGAFFSKSNGECQSCSLSSLVLKA